MHFNCYSTRPENFSHRPHVRVCPYRETMFRRKANTALNSSHRWLSHRTSSPRKSPSSYALTRNAAVVATSLAAVAAATIASQKFFNEGPIHNDAYPSSPKANAKELRVGGRDWDEDELRLLVWGSNRYVQYMCLCALIRSQRSYFRAHI